MLGLRLGGTAGIVSVLVTHPLDLMKTRFIYQPYGRKTYTSIWQAGRVIFKREGFKGLYKGVIPACVGVIPYEGFTFMSYEIFKRWFDGKVGYKQHLMAGSMAVAVSQIFSYPFDLIKKRLQASSTTTGMLHVTYKGAVWVLCKC